jgi:hypothetical protein
MRQLSGMRLATTPVRQSIGATMTHSSETLRAFHFHDRLFVFNFATLTEIVLVFIVAVVVVVVVATLLPRRQRPAIATTRI